MISTCVYWIFSQLIHEHQETFSIKNWPPHQISWFILFVQLIINICSYWLWIAKFSQLQFAILTQKEPKKIPYSGALCSTINSLKGFNLHFFQSLLSRPFMLHNMNRYLQLGPRFFSMHTWFTMSSFHGFGFRHR